MKTAGYDLFLKVLPIRNARLVEMFFNFGAWVRS
jgi:hypothetical protein